VACRNGGQWRGVESSGMLRGWWVLMVLLQKTSMGNYSAVTLSKPPVSAPGVGLTVCRHYNII
jgi:hypothetical protein